MEHESELTINADLPKALGEALADGMEPTPELALAACLQQLTVRNGLAQRDDPAHSSVRSANLPAPALALLDLYFGADGEPASDDDVRNGLCEVLGYLSTKPGVLRSVNKARPLTGEDFLVFAQIYWNLDAEAPRGVLPIAAGQKLSNGKKAYIKVDGADEDYAQLELKQRASRTPGYSRAGGAFYVRGARVAALVAKRLVATRKHTADAAELRSTRTGRGVEWSIVWPGAQPSAETRVAAGGEPDASARHVDPTIATLRQLRQRNLADGNLSEAAFLCTALLSILQDRSEKNPGDDEPQLADEYLRTGLTYGVAGRAEEALDHFVKAERAFQTLHELTPGESTYRLELAVSGTMIGAFHLQAARVDDAEAALVDAVALSQELTDEDSRNEDMLAASLSVLGLVYVQSGRPGNAIKILTRAVTIAQKIATQDPSDNAKQLQLANALTTLGMLHLQAGDNQRAEEDLMRSLAAGEELAARDPKDRMTRLLIASDQAMLGMIWLFSDKYEDAANALTAAVALAQELIKQHPDEGAQLTLAGALYTGGLLCMVTDRLQEAESRFAAAVTVSRDLIALGQKGLVSPAQKTRASTFLGSSLYFLGLIYVELEREEAAEEVLVEAVRVFERRQQDEADQKMLADTLEALSDLFEEQGRPVDAQRTRERRRGLDDSNPETPAPA